MDRFLVYLKNRVGNFEKKMALLKGRPLNFFISSTRNIYVFF